MAHKSALIPGDWILFRTPEGNEVALATDEIVAVWAGLTKGTIVIERNYGEPITVQYPSVRQFCSEYLDHYDERRRPRRPKATGPVLKLLPGTKVLGGTIAKPKRDDR